MQLSPVPKAMDLKRTRDSSLAIAHRVLHTEINC
jgi:hypothetical protein